MELEKDGSRDSSPSWMDVSLGGQRLHRSFTWVRDYVASSHHGSKIMPDKDGLYDMTSDLIFGVGVPINWAECFLSRPKKT
jgi:hypothetical protein